MTPDLETIAAGFSEMVKDALRTCRPWDVEVGAGIAIAFCANGLLEDSTICDDGVQLSPLGLQLRTYLESRTRGEGE